MPDLLRTLNSNSAIDKAAGLRETEKCPLAVNGNSITGRNALWSPFLRGKASLAGTDFREHSCQWWRLLTTANQKCITKPDLLMLSITANHIARRGSGGGAGLPLDPRFWGPKIEHFWALFNFSIFFFASLHLAYYFINMLLFQSSNSKIFQPCFAWHMISHLQVFLFSLSYTHFRLLGVHLSLTQGGHGTGKTRNLVLTFSRQGKHREFCFDTEKFWDTGKIFFCDIGKNVDTGKTFDRDY